MLRLPLLHRRRSRARDEGMAAGLGILTGSRSRRWARRGGGTRPCPECGERASIEVLDLVSRRTTWRCRSCSHEWVDQHLPR